MTRLPVPATGRTGPAAWAFTDRAGGVSAAPFASLNLASHVGDDPEAVAANRGRALARLTAGPGPAAPLGLATMRPNHGTGVAVVGGPGETADVDALVSATPGLALLALGADCVPALLVDPAAGVVAAVHSGWLGVRDDVVGAALTAMAGLGADAARTVALLGPSVCGACYPVPRERAEQVARVSPVAVGVSIDGQPTVDVRAAVAERLGAAGLAVSLVGGCTFESADLFSHRRDGLTGRQGGVIALDPA